MNDMLGDEEEKQNGLLTDDDERALLLPSQQTAQMFKPTQYHLERAEAAQNVERQLSEIRYLSFHFLHLFFFFLFFVFFFFRFYIGVVFFKKQK